MNYCSLIRFVLEPGKSQTEVCWIWPTSHLATDCERLVPSSRWLAAKYAMFRWGLACGMITLDKVPGESNRADLMTKPIIGSRFAALRARALGLPS